ncbi:hypothetical protein BDV12DRAFT_1610 [Aspergillus spectabilis]
MGFEAKPLHYYFDIDRFLPGLVTPLHVAGRLCMHHVLCGRYYLVVLCTTRHAGREMSSICSLLAKIPGKGMSRLVENWTAMALGRLVVHWQLIALVILLVLPTAV